MKKITRLHSDSVRKVIAVEMARLGRRCRNVAAKHPSFAELPNASVVLSGYTPQITDIQDIAGMSRIIDDLIPLEMCERLLEDMMGSDADNYYASILDEMVGYHTALVDSMATSREYEAQDDITELLTIVTAQQGINAIRRQENKQLDEEGFLRIAAEATMKDDPFFRYSLTNGTIPFSIYKWLIEEKIPRTDAIVSVCKDYGAKWRALLFRMDHARKNNIVDDFTWTSMYKDEAKIFSDWKETVLLLSGKTHGKQSAVSRHGDVSQGAKS